MKKSIGLLFLFGFVSCFGDDYRDYNYIPDIPISVTKNLNLPASNTLLVPGGFVVYPELGHRGVVVYRQHDDYFSAFDLACPHIPLSECSKPMDFTNFPEFTNSCNSDGIFYNIALGGSMTYQKDEKGSHISVKGKTYDMQQYNVVLMGNGNELHIRNF